MTRLGRRASLLVAFSLLAAAATAYAECAWVLWIKVHAKDMSDPTSGKADLSTEPFFYEPRAYATKGECDRESRRQASPCRV